MRSGQLPPLRQASGSRFAGLYAEGLLFSVWFLAENPSKLLSPHGICAIIQIHLCAIGSDCGASAAKCGDRIRGSAGYSRFVRSDRRRRDAGFCSGRRLCRSVLFCSRSGSKSRCLAASIGNFRFQLPVGMPRLPLCFAYASRMLFLCGFGRDLLF